jgi:hypothetical protein
MALVVMPFGLCKVNGRTESSAGKEMLLDNSVIHGSIR